MVFARAATSKGLAEAPTPVQGGDTLRIPEVFLAVSGPQCLLLLLLLLFCCKVFGASKRKALSTSACGVLCQGALRTNDKR